ncbi:MAG TPA: exodeoxyribonuclease VII large subunit, partial [Bacillota bacterium]|nr:exodeoxyribonuclease VII large subunit [Bacillota bacterium]
MMGFHFEQDDAGMAEAVVTVSDLNYRLARMFEDEPDLSGIAVIGEVSDLKMYPSGHWYCSLKDAKSQLKAVMFRSSAQRQVASGFIPENGMMVVAKGDIRVYEPNGVYQIIVESMAPAGEGAKYV